MGPRHWLPGIAMVLVLAAWPSAAAAATFCVLDSTCTGDHSNTTIAGAIADANANGTGLDRIQVGPGTFSETGLVALNTNPVEIDGAGQGATTVTRGALVGATVLHVAGAQAVVSDLTVHLPAGQQMTALGLNQGALGERVRLSAHPAVTQGHGANVSNSTLRTSVVTLPSGQMAGNTGVDASGAALLDSNGVFATLGVRLIGSGAKKVRGNRITAHTGVRLEGGAQDTSATVENTQVTSLAPAGVEDSAIEAHEDGFGGATNTALTVRHVTLLGPGAGRGLYSRADSGMAAVTTLSASDSLIRGYAVDLEAQDSGSGTASLTISHSAFDPTKTLTTPGAQVNIVPPNVNLNGVDPRLRDFLGDMRPGFDSPLVDAGVPGALQSSESTTDLAGLPRLVDGNGDGTARRDIGAFEYQRTPPEITASVPPATAEAGQPISFSATATDADPGELPAIGWSFDDGGTASGPSVEHAFATPGQHTATATAVDPAGVATSTAVTVAVIDSAAPDGSIGTSALRLNRRGIAAVPVTCPATEVSGPCAGVLALATDRRVRRTPRAKPRRVRLGSKPYSVPAGQTARVRVRLSRANRRLVTRLRRVRVRATTSVADQAGNTKRLTARFVLRPPVRTR